MNYNKKFTDKETQRIEDQTRKQMQESDPLFSGGYYEAKQKIQKIIQP